jgi:hypothetical protein
LLAVAGQALPLLVNHETRWSQSQHLDRRNNNVASFMVSRTVQLHGYIFQIAPLPHVRHTYLSGLSFFAARRTASSLTFPVSLLIVPSVAFGEN